MAQTPKKRKSKPQSKSKPKPATKSKKTGLSARELRQMYMLTSDPGTTFGPTLTKEQVEDILEQHRSKTKPKPKKPTQISKKRFEQLASTKKCEELGITKSNIKSKEQRRRLGPVVRQGCTMNKATLQKHARDRKCAGRAQVTKGGKTKAATKKQIVQAIAKCPKRTPNQKKNNDISGLQEFQKNVAKVLKGVDIAGGMKGLHKQARNLRNQAKAFGKKHPYFKDLYEPSETQLKKYRGETQNKQIDNLFLVNKSLDLILEERDIKGRKDLFQRAKAEAAKKKRAAVRKGTIQKFKGKHTKFAD